MTPEVISDGARRAALHDLGLLDTGPEERFDRVTRLVTRLLGVPVALVSLVDQDRQFFKSQQGLPSGWADVRQAPLSHSFCRHVVGHKEPLVIGDVRESSLSENLVVRDLDVAAYAGIPLVLGDGYAVGALCAIDTSPRVWSDADIETLTDLSAAVVTVLELRGALATHSLHDRLTGLPNRALLAAQCEQLLDAAEGTESVAVLTAGIDGFSSINEAYGATAADGVLKDISDRLDGLLRKGDVLGRLQGDVFVLLCRHVNDEREALGLAQRIREGVSAQTVTVGQDKLVVSVTLGISMAREDCRADDMIARAAEAMRQAKSHRGHVHVAEEGAGELVAARLRLRGALPGAVARDEISVAFQPIVDMITERTEGFEALARWVHPELGVVSPGHFIPIAESSGDIVAIGEHVLRTACDQLAEWRAASGEALHISVNLSPLQLEQPNIVDIVSEVLATSGLPGNALGLEITEGVLLEAGPVPQRNFERLREIGVRMVLDDFGTGYSALGYLKRFPLDVLKIDRSFVDGLGGDRRDEALVKAILTMGDGMDMGVVAEGIETRGQSELLQRLGCRHAQGYFYGRPQAAADIVAMSGPVPVPG